MLAKVHSAQVTGIKVDIVDVEVDVARGLHSFSIVGLADKAVGEAKDRISSAIKNSGYASPLKGANKITVSLAPADIKKEGTVFDLAIAMACLIATKEIKFETKKRLFLGELALSGDLRGIHGVLLLVKKAKDAGYTEIYLPKENAREGALIRGVKIYGCESLKQVAHFLSPDTKAEKAEVDFYTIREEPETKIPESNLEQRIDFADVKGQGSAKRGLEIAAAGGHNVAMFGPPGTGKTMLARAFAGILPNLDFDEVIEVTGIHSVAGALEDNLIIDPPFRSPHHTSSYVSLVGGGTWPKPGEITLAHRGVLFLDEFPEFEKRVIEALRQPLEDKVIYVSRAKGTVAFPANFMLVAAMNPCPCGNRGAKDKRCICTIGEYSRYERKISGPIIDRIDLWLEVPQIDHVKLSSTAQEESSRAVSERVRKARAIQAKRFAGEKKGTKTNAEMGVRELKVHAPLTPASLSILNQSAKKLDLSARAYHRVIKLARTIADLEGARDIKENHLLEALQYRPRK